MQAWHCSSWWMRPTHRAQTHVCPLAAIGDACPGVLGEKMQAGETRPALNWVSVAARPPVPPPPAAARSRVRGPDHHPTRCPLSITANWLRPAAPAQPKDLTMTATAFSGPEIVSGLPPSSQACSNRDIRPAPRGLRLPSRMPWRHLGAFRIS